MANLYADEAFPGPVVRELRKLGHDVETALQAGLANRRTPDVDQLNYAIQQARALLTRNRRHFIRLHSRVQPHRGIIVCSEDDDFTAQAQQVHQALIGCPSLTNQLLRIHKT